MAITTTTNFKLKLRCRKGTLQKFKNESASQPVEKKKLTRGDQTTISRQQHAYFLKFPRKSRLIPNSKASRRLACRCSQKYKHSTQGSSLGLFLFPPKNRKADFSGVWWWYLTTDYNVCKFYFTLWPICLSTTKTMKKEKRSMKRKLHI